MNETPTGPMTGSILRLERMLLCCPAFIERIGGETELDTQESIKLFEHEDDPELLRKARPFAAIWPADEMDFQAVSGGSKNLITGQGELVLMLTDNDRMPSDVRASWFDFGGWIDSVFMFLKENSARDDFLRITQLRWLDKPAHTPRQEPEQDWHFWMTWLVEWN